MRFTVVPAFALASLLCADAATAGKAMTKRERDVLDSHVICLAGCRTRAPVAIDRAPLLRTHSAAAANVSGGREVLADLWCGDGGGCVAINHLPPPDWNDEPSRGVAIGVFVGRW